jgi:tripartite ATP-independent transporter DctP family solute receptor
MSKALSRRSVIKIAAAGSAMTLASPSVFAQTKTITGRLNHVKTIEEPFHKVILEVVRKISERSNGELQIRVFPAAQLGEEIPAAESVSTGSIQMHLVSASGAGTFHPPFGAFIAPYAFKEWKDVRKVADGKLGAELNGQLSAKKNMHVLEYFNDGSRVMVTRTKPIKTMADLQGLKIRVPPSKVFLETFKAFGAAATPMAYGDLFPALQQGVVDGCDFGLALIEPARAYEIAKHVSTTRHMRTALGLLVNSVWQKSLPPNLQKILAEEMRAGSDRVTQIVDTDELTAVENLRKRGMTVIEDPDLSGFQKAAELVPKVMSSDWGEGFWEKLQAAKASS